MIKDLTIIPGVGPKNLKQFRDKGIWNTYDLATYLPKKYHNFSIVDVANLKHLEEATVIGKIHAPIFTVKRKVTWSTTTILVQDKLIKLIIFGRDYIAKEFKVDDVVLIKGKYNMFKNEMNVIHMTKNQDTPDIQPIY